MQKNTNLRQTLTNLQLYRTSNFSLDQQDVNTNIVIRGVDVNENTPETELLAVYEAIRSHINISDVTVLTPVSVAVLSPNPTSSNTSFRPIRVQLPSVAAKKKLLQIIKVKRDILYSNIGIKNACRCPIVIS